MAYKDQHDLYWHYDTTELSGSLYRSQSTSAGIGIQVPQVEELTITPMTSGYDLANMMNPRDYYKEQAR